MSRTKIEWTGETWNPVTGCTKISPGCLNCYAERMARTIRDQCLARGIPFFYKGSGGKTKKENVKTLDGVEWKQFPR